jgi:hypothetical protein
MHTWQDRRRRELQEHRDLRRGPECGRTRAMEAQVLGQGMADRVAAKSGIATSAVEDGGRAVLQREIPLLCRSLEEFQYFCAAPASSTAGDSSPAR